jgi:hypothetical protein
MAISDRPKITELPGSHFVPVSIAAIATGTSDEVLAFINSSGRTVQFTAFDYAPDTAVSGATPNNMKLDIQNKGAAGTGTTAMVTQSNFVTGTDIAQFDVHSFTLASTAASLQVPNGGTVTLKKTEGGTGADLPAGMLNMAYKYL